MDNENEARPLLHSFENESWRSRARKRCMRIPSEITITGIILGLFLVVVTLLIVLENMETEKKDDIALDDTLLASPFKYNKKAEDKSWQNKKDDMKKRQKEENQKWDKANKGWKKFPDISGKIDYGGSDGWHKTLRQSFETSEIPEVLDVFGKEIDDSVETFLNLQMSDPSLMKKFNKDASEIRNLLHSGINWKKVDEGWKDLSEQGWKDKEIRGALFKALKEKREEIRDSDDVLQSPTNLDDIWAKIIESWKKNIHEGTKAIEYQKIKGDKEAERQKAINDEWKDEMNILQSPKSSIKKSIKEDAGWQKLIDQGWKKKDIEAALIEALIEASKEKPNVLQSPMNIQDLWGKATNFLKNLVQKGMDKQKSQKEINDEWANKFGNLLQSPKTSYKKWKEIDELRKKHSKDDWKDKSSDKTQNEDEQSLQSPTNFEDFMENIIEMVKEHQKDKKDKYSDKTEDPLQSPTKFEDFMENIVEAIKKHQKDRKDKSSDKADNENEQLLQSPTNFDELMKNIIEAIKDHQKGNKEAEKQKGINDEWKNGMGVLYSSKQTDKKWKQVDDHWKTLIEHERNSFFGRNDGDSTSIPGDDSLQRSMSLDNVKWAKIDDGWNKLTEQGWKDKDLKEAVYKAWKEGDKLLQSAMGHNNMKWKKVNDGWKKISNKS